MRQVQKNCNTIFFSQSFRTASWQHRPYYKYRKSPISMISKKGTGGVYLLFLEKYRQYLQTMPLYVLIKPQYIAKLNPITSVCFLWADLICLCTWNIYLFCSLEVKGSYMPWDVESFRSELWHYNRMWRMLYRSRFSCYISNIGIQNLYFRQ